MPRKIRQLIAEVLSAGFHEKSIEGDHRKYERNGIVIMISGGLGDDALRYQEKHLKTQIKKAAELDEE